MSNEAGSVEVPDVRTVECLCGWEVPCKFVRADAVALWGASCQNCGRTVTAAIDLSPDNPSDLAVATKGS